MRVQPRPALRPAAAPPPCRADVFFQHVSRCAGSMEVVLPKKAPSYL